MPYSMALVWYLGHADGSQSKQSRGATPRARHSRGGNLKRVQRLGRQMRGQGHSRLDHHLLCMSNG